MSASRIALRPSCRGASAFGGVLLVTLALSVLSGGPILAQEGEGEGGPRWERRSERTTPRPTVFHSTQGVNLPTTETLDQGELFFEISHRFQPPISDAMEALYGFDGPVMLRLGLAYAVHDRVMVGIQRSNVDDNVDLFAKGRFWEGDFGSVIASVGAQAGVAWNTQLGAGFEEADDLQLHGAGIIDLLMGERLAIGLVPNFVANPDPRQEDEDKHLGLGVLSQFYMSESVSLVAEYVSGSEIVNRAPEDSFSAGVEFEVGGHFFKIVVTNSLRLNPAQFYTGALDPIAMDNLRFGFNVTRLFAF